MNLLPQFFYAFMGWNFIGSLSMVDDGAGVGGAGRALAGGEGWGWESDL